MARYRRDPDAGHKCAQAHLLIEGAGWTPKRAAKHYGVNLSTLYSYRHKLKTEGKFKLTDVQRAAAAAEIAAIKSGRSKPQKGFTQSPSHRAKGRAQAKPAAAPVNNGMYDDVYDEVRRLRDENTRLWELVEFFKGEG